MWKVLYRGQKASGQVLRGAMFETVVAPCVAVFCRGT